MFRISNCISILLLMNILRLGENVFEDKSIFENTLIHYQ